MKLIGVNSITLSRKISSRVQLSRANFSLSLSLLPTRFLREPGNNILTAVIKKSSSRNERRAESRQENLLSITLSRRKYELDQSSLPRLYMKKKRKKERNILSNTVDHNFFLLEETSPRLRINKSNDPIIIIRKRKNTYQGGA